MLVIEITSILLIETKMEPYVPVFLARHVLPFDAGDLAIVGINFEIIDFAVISIDGVSHKITVQNNSLGFNDQ